MRNDALSWEGIPNETLKPSLPISSFVAFQKQFKSWIKENWVPSSILHIERLIHTVCVNGFARVLD